ncbi:MAG: 50S ribosomal protein L17 [bacterium]
MRHKKKMVKLGRPAEARKALLSSMAGNFIEEQRIKTTLPKARLTRSLAEKLVTVAKKAIASGKPDKMLQGKRKALAVLRHRKPMMKLFDVIAPQYKDRLGGYTRIVKVGRRGSDSSEMAILEWVDLAFVKKGKQANKSAAASDEPVTGESKKES